MKQLLAGVIVYAIIFLGFLGYYLVVYVYSMQMIKQLRDSRLQAEYARIADNALKAALWSPLWPYLAAVTVARQHSEDKRLREAVNPQDKT